jgi:hypothetical protein
MHNAKYTFMRNIILLLYFFTISSCHKKTETEIAQNVEVEKPEMTDKEFIKRLIKADFFKYTDPTVNIKRIDSLNAYAEYTNKFARIDAEELAEFSFGYFTPQLTKMLSIRNIDLLLKKTGNTEKTNEVKLNGENLILYSKEELENGSFLNSAASNLFKKLNSILEEKKCNERFYLIYDGNDLSTFLLTNSQYQVFVEKYESIKYEIPRNP